MIYVLPIALNYKWVLDLIMCHNITNITTIVYCVAPTAFGTQNIFTSVYI